MAYCCPRLVQCTAEEEDVYRDNLARWPTSGHGIGLPLSIHLSGNFFSLPNSNVVALRLYCTCFADLNPINHATTCAFSSGEVGRGSLGVKVSHRVLACHDFEPSKPKDPPCRGAMHVKSVESSNRPPVGMVL
ncbi:hypothetical protein TNCV_3021841 [Trichonephila clavipes]|nr:hypothetical protein TNCV_3021841 [Trichonephila clavipes]